MERNLPARWTGCFALLLACLAPAAARGQALLPDGFDDVEIAGGFDMPTAMAFVPDAGPLAGRRLFVTEQNSANVWLLVDGQRGAAPAGVVPGVRHDFWERGLLGIAVDPRWPAKPYVYVHFTATDSCVHMARYTVTGDLAWSGSGALQLDSTSRYEVIANVPDQNDVHNGGTLRFGPDGMLYESFGDDHDWCAAQDTSSLLGKILRLDVSRLPDGPGGPAPRALIAPADNPFAARPDSNAWLVDVLGLRNPFRFQIDPDNGALFVADVGENSWEEVDRVRPGMNCGWPMWEGFQPGVSCGPENSTLTFPIYTYDHSQGVAVMALGVCRPARGGAFAFPSEYDGDFFLADYFGGWFRKLSRETGDWVIDPDPGQPDPVDWIASMPNVSDGTFGPDGALWFVVQSVSIFGPSGEIHAIRPQITAGVGGPRPAAFALGPPAPNPGAPPLALAYVLPAEAEVRLAVHDVAGRLVRLLDAGRRGPGRHTLAWDGRGDDGRAAPPGLYLVSLRAGGSAASRRVVLQR